MPLALITGAGIRVGRAIAIALANAGYDLVLHAHRSQQGLSEVAAIAKTHQRSVQQVLADLSATDGVATLTAAIQAQHQALDVLVNSAGAYERLPFADLSRASYARMMAVNLEAPLFLTQALLPLLRAAPAPCVINITDASIDKPYAGYTHYMVSKAALSMLTRTLAIELAPRIRVNAVAPGTVVFPSDFDPAKRQRIVSRIPLARAGTAEDIGRAVVYLVRDAPYVTGQTIAVDGGATLV